jgi:hypothetical protein
MVSENRSKFTQEGLNHPGVSGDLIPWKDQSYGTSQ